jgi:signal transduction histidine kinase
MRTVRAVLTVKRAVYLLLSLGLGTTWFVILVVGLSTGIGLLITLLGIPILIGVLYATRPMADLERALVHGLLDERADGHYRRPAREGVWSSIRARVADPQTWKDTAYLACQFPLGIIWFTLTSIAIVVPTALLLAPLWYWATPGGIDVLFWDVDSLPEACLLVPIGALLVLPARYLVDGMGIAHGYWARLLLHSEPDPELTAKVVDARSAQVRIIAAADAERRRIERDLHDGAQQRLVALSLKLGMARKRLGDDADGMALQLVDEAQAESRAALEELRDLARGIHPAVLSDRGLGAALRELASRATVPTEVVEAPEARLLPAVEGTAYFVVAECLTNIGKYAKATSATVRVRPEVGRLVVEVVDDGIGGADAERGSGLRGLADRVGALSGSLEVASPPGHGTRVRAEIPLVGG